MDNKWLKDAMKIAHDVGEAMVRERQGECGPLSVSVEFARLEAHLQQAVAPKPIRVWMGPVKAFMAPIESPVPDNPVPIPKRQE
jgi:hypothetical protein